MPDVTFTFSPDDSTPETIEVRDLDDAGIVALKECADGQHPDDVLTLNYYIDGAGPRRGIFRGGRISDIRVKDR